MGAEEPVGREGRYKKRPCGSERYTRVQPWRVNKKTPAFAGVLRTGVPARGGNPPLAVGVYDFTSILCT